MLAREKDDNTPKLQILLCETLVGVYVSLLVTALATYDCSMLYKLIAHRFVQQMWGALFGGGSKTVLRVSDSQMPLSKYMYFCDLDREIFLFSCFLSIFQKGCSYSMSKKSFRYCQLIFS